MTRPGAALLLAASLAGAACAGNKTAGDQATKPADGEPLTQSTESGPVKATVTLTPKQPRLGDAITLTLTVEAAAGVTVEMPAFGEALGRFSIINFTPRQHTEANGHKVLSQRYTLQAPMSGRQRIPRLRIEFADGRPGQQHDAGAGAAPTHELLTDEIAIQIESVLPDGELAAELRPARAALPPPPERGVLARWWPWLASALAALCLFLAWRAWRRAAAIRTRVSAYDAALKRLGALERRGLPHDHEVDGWYVELSAIVRRYLEDRFGVRAPELTTEEFLREARRAGGLTDAHRSLLSTFLEGCDRVKFARYAPDEHESREALTAARRFIEETRVRAEPVANAPAAAPAPAATHEQPPG
jgi:hypothetical protein